MSLLVQKFGGTSVATLERIERAAMRVKHEIEQGNSVVVVVSAMGEETDTLLDLANHFNLPEYTREHDCLLSTGEQKSMALFALALMRLGCKARSLNAAQAGIHASGPYGYARIVDIDIHKITPFLMQGEVVVIAGFQGMVGENIATLGRGGSDLSAVALAAALKADECQIFTDVDGVRFADPRLVPLAHKLDTINIQEMLELARLGAKVLHDRAVLLAKKMNVRLRVRSSFDRGEGTLVAQAGVDQPSLVGITSQEAQVLIRLSLPQLDVAIIQHYLASIHVGMSSMQVIEDGLVELLVIMPQEVWFHAKTAVAALLDSIHHQLIVCESLVQISLIGRGVHLEASIREKFYQVLGEYGCNILYSTGSEVALSVLTEVVHLPELMERLYQILHSSSC